MEVADSRYREFFEMSLDMLCIAGVDGFFYHLNPAWERLLGYPESELKERPFIEFVHPDDREKTLAEASKLAGGDWDTVSFINRYQHRDGSYRWLLWSSRLSRDGQALLAVARDISELKHTELRLREATREALAANAAKSDFMANMSHELRTPLNSIIGFGNLLLKNRPGNLVDSQREYLSRIASSGLHLLSLINDVLDLSKIESGRLQIQVEPVDLTALIGRLMASLESQARQAELRFEAVLGDVREQIRADPRRLEQVLLNLIGNALKFTRRGGVLLRVVSDGGRPLRIDVVDTGIGIDPSRIESLFEAFEQADATTAREFGGTGLGLSIARALTEAMGFEIAVDGAVGVGSTFSVLIDPSADKPVHAPPQWPAHGSRSSLVASSQPGVGSSEVEADRLVAPRDRQCILIIDDDVDARSVLERLLTDEGYEVVAVDSAANGFAIARHLKPDAITLDLMMPVEDGVSLLGRLRDDPKTRSIPIVVISIVASERRTMVGPADDVLDKPFSAEQLKSALRTVLASKPGSVVVVDDSDEIGQPS